MSISFPLPLHLAPVLQPGETVHLVVNSMDIGSRFLAIGQYSLLLPTERVVVNKCIVCNLMGPNGENDYHTFMRNLDVLLQDQLSWIWDAAIPLLCESQSFQLALMRKRKRKTYATSVEDDDDDDPANEEPMNCIIEAAILRMFYDRQRPLVLLQDSGWDYLKDDRGVDMKSPLLNRTESRWVKRSGKSKTGLTHLRGKERKAAAYQVGLQVMMASGDPAMAQWLRDVKLATKYKKPAEGMLPAILPPSYSC